MFRENKELYEFDKFRLDVSERFLLKSGKRVEVTDRAFDTLCALVRRGNRLISKDELLTEVWADAIVEENNLDKNISALRRILGERDSNKQTFIETVRGHGYRFVAEVRRIEDDLGFRISDLGFESGNRNDDERPTANDELITKDQKPKTRDQTENPQSQIPNPKSSNVVALASWRHESADGDASTAETATHEIQNEPILNAAPADVAPKTKSNKLRWAALAICALLVTAGIGYALYKFANPSPMIFEAGKTTRLTSTGKVLFAVVLPDGKHVAYVQWEEQRSLWMLNIASQSAVELTAPDKSKFHGLQFAPDGNHFYYHNSSGSLYRMPVLGGTPVEVFKLKNKFDYGLTLSPDEKHIAFTRNPAGNNLNETIIVANADGTDERELFSPGKSRLSILAWSLDGKTIAVQLENREKNYSVEIWAIQVADGTAAPVLAPIWDDVSDAAWMPDGKSLLVAAEENGTNLPQIWQVPYPSGEARRITDDLNIYNFFSLSADGRFLVSPRMEQTAHIWTMPANDGSRARKLTSGENKYDGTHGISWLPDGRIVYDSSPNGKKAAWIAKADGSNFRQLSNAAFTTTASPDGRYIVFADTTIEKSGLWRMNLSDGSLLRLTNGADTQPTFSPDGKWVVYVHYPKELDGHALRKVSTDGGESVTLPQYFTFSGSPAVSPDGKQIAFYFKKKDQGKSESGIALMSFESGEMMKTFNVQPDACRQCGKTTLQWTADGRAINYVKLWNIWQQPIDGSAPVQITNFTGYIFNFAFSPDGSQLALSRGTVNSDVVLIENQK